MYISKVSVPQFYEFYSQNREMEITLTMKATPGLLNQTLVHCQAKSGISRLTVTLMLPSLSTYARILSSMVLSGWLGWVRFVDQTVGKGTKLPSMRKERTKLQLLRFQKLNCVVRMQS